MTPLRLLPWLGVWLITLVAMIATPAFAQSGADSDNGDAAQATEPQTYESLADLLEDEQGRQELIDLLRSRSRGAFESDSEAAEEAAQGSDIAPEDVSLPRQLAELTSSVVSDVGSQFEQIVSLVSSLLSVAEKALLTWRLSQAPRLIWAS